MYWICPRCETQNIDEYDICEVCSLKKTKGSGNKHFLIFFRKHVILLFILFTLSIISFLFIHIYNNSYSNTVNILSSSNSKYKIFSPIVQDSNKNTSSKKNSKINYIDVSIKYYLVFSICDLVRVLPMTSFQLFHKVR